MKLNGNARVSDVIAWTVVTGRRESSRDNHHDNEEGNEEGHEEGHEQDHDPDGRPFGVQSPSCRPRTRCCISEVPSPISISFASR